MGFIVTFIRKYLSLIIPSAIAVLALLILLPTWLIGKGLKQDLSKSLSQAKRVTSMVGDIPSSQQWQQEKLYQDEHEKEAQRIKSLMIQSSQRELISYQIFPKPTDSSIQLFMDYGDSYREAIEKLITSIGALDAPSEHEIQQAGGVATARRTNRPTGGYSAAGSRTDQRDELIDAVCMKRAQTIPVYGHPSLFEWYEFWEDYDYQGQDLAVQDCWYSQISYWIYDDIIQAVNEINAGSRKVTTSPVKRILGVKFSGPIDTTRSARRTTVRTPSRSGAAEGDRFEYVLDPRGSLFGIPAWTGRVSDDDLDVIHFAASFVVTVKEIPQFIETLCSDKQHQFREGFSQDGQVYDMIHNQITVLDYSHKPIDMSLPEHTYYRYGEEGVARLDLVCEYILSKEGYEPIKPESIKTLFESQESRGFGY